MDQLCTIRIEAKECSLEFQVQKSLLYTYSRYFQNIIDQDQNKTDFSFSNTSFDKDIYTLYFSEFNTKDIPINQINSDLDESILNKLFELNEIIQSDTIKTKINGIFKTNQYLGYLLQKFSNEKGEKHNDEKLIIEKINENNINKFLESNLNQERKMRILSKYMTIMKFQNSRPNEISSIIFNNQNDNINNETGEIFMIIYFQKEIFEEKEKRKFKIKNENIIIPSINEFIQEKLEQINTIAMNNVSSYNHKRIEHQEGKNFEGIIKYLETEYGKDIHQQGIITIINSSTDSHANPPYSVIDYDSNTNWHPIYNFGEWWGINFKSMRVKMTGYSIKTYEYGPGFNHLKKWVIEGRNNGNKWKEINQQDNNDLNGSLYEHYYSLPNMTEPFQFIRIKITGINHYNQYCLVLNQFEVYGEIIEEVRSII